MNAIALRRSVARPGHVGTAVRAGPHSAMSPEFTLDTRETGVTVAESGGSTDVTEDGTADTYTVVLTSQPTADVTVTLAPDARV